MVLPVKIVTIENQVFQEEYGGKAFWLSWLRNEGYNVPDAILVSAMSHSTWYACIDDSSFLEALEKHLEPFCSDDEFYVAVRSSATIEDMMDNSMAGHFKTYFGKMSYQEVLNRIGDVIHSLNDIEVADTALMGVIIQRYVIARFSGVVFSSDPITFSKTCCIITATEGQGADLVSGKKQGEDIRLEIDSETITVSDYELKMPVKYLKELSSIAKEIEQRVGFAVELEWSVESESGILYLLQCRPITGLGHIDARVVPITIANKIKFPPTVLHNEKVVLRTKAEEAGVHVSNGYLIPLTSFGIQQRIPDLDVIIPSDRCVAYSVVLIHPKTINGRVLRYFVDAHPNRKQLDEAGIIVRTPLFSNLRECLEHIADESGKHCWSPVAIVQEIYDADYGGIARRVGENIIIEIARGHFVPKGVVPTSQYLIHPSGDLVKKREVNQDHVFRICEGYVLKHKLKEGGSTVVLPIEILHRIVKDLNIFLKDSNINVEFGILHKNRKKDTLTYLIDVNELRSDTEIDSESLSSGIISRGKVTGRIVKWNGQVDTSSSLDTHMYDQLNAQAAVGLKLIILADRPDISLLEIVKRQDPANIGFIFREGSILVHLSIVLRERGIPAIVSEKIPILETGRSVTIDAATPGLSAYDRIIVTKPPVYVFTLTNQPNPDTDGICSSIAYCNIMNEPDVKFMPIIQGELNAETKFILDKFGVKMPIKTREGSQGALYILLDTHRLEQIPEFVDPMKVIRIIDHHPDDYDIGSVFTNAEVINEPVGATATLVTEIMKLQGKEPSEDIASILAASIVSNTLNFRAPSTSKRDSEAFHWLQTFTNINEQFIEKMFLARSDFTNKTTTDILLSDYKQYDYGESRVVISQIEAIDVQKLLSREDLFESIKEAIELLQADYYFLNVVDIGKGHSFVVTFENDTKKLVGQILERDFKEPILTVPRILLRKTDFVPFLGNALANIDSSLRKQNMD